MIIFNIVMAILLIALGIHWLNEYADDREFWEIVLSLFNFGLAISWIVRIFN